MMRYLLSNLLTEFVENSRIITIFHSWDGLVVRISALQSVNHGVPVVSCQVIPKTIIKWYKLLPYLTRRNKQGANLIV